MNALLVAYLAQIGRCNEAVTPEVDKWVQDLLHEDPAVRDAVRRWLLKNNDQADFVVELLCHPNAALVFWAERTLIEIGTPARAWIERALDRTQNEIDRRTLTRALSRIR